jgi:hypothetical protein
MALDTIVAPTEAKITSTRGWPQDVIADFRQALWKLRETKRWNTWVYAAEDVGCTENYIAWAADRNDATWPGSNKLAARLKAVYQKHFAWTPPAKRVVYVKPGMIVVLAPGETVRKPSGRQRPRVRRCWMGKELTVEMDKAGVTDATVRWLVTRYIYERELAGPVPGVEGKKVL